MMNTHKLVIGLGSLLAVALLAAPPLFGADAPAEEAILAEEATEPRHPFPSRREAEEARPPRSADGDEDGERAERRFRSREGTDDMAMLDRLLAMSPEQLARVRQIFERIEAMSPEEREGMRTRIRELREIPPEERQKMRELWREMSPEERREHIREMRERRWQKVLEQADPDGEQSPD